MSEVVGLLADYMDAVRQLDSMLITGQEESAEADGLKMQIRSIWGRMDGAQKMRIGEVLRRERCLVAARLAHGDEG